MPGRTNPIEDHTTPTPGRHRRASRLPAPVGLALLVGVLLLTVGAGAALIRPSLAGGDDQATNTAAEYAGTGRFGAASAVQATPSASPSPTAKPSPTPAVTPTRAANPKPKRTTSRPSGGTRGSTGGSTAQSADENKVVEITNQERAEAGCGPVTVNAKLASAARQHSQDQAEHNKMSHTGSDGSSPWDRAERAGYRNAIGENVAMGYRTPAAVMDGWMNSDGHRANILNCDAKAIGVGLAYAGDGSPYWTQMFGSVA